MEGAERNLSQKKKVDEHEQLRRSFVIGNLFAASGFVVANELLIDHCD